MTCKQINLGGGATAIVCTRGSDRGRCKCGRVATRLCDFELSGRKAGQTCSAKLCEKCSTRPPASELDYCPAHARLLEQRHLGWRTVAEMSEAWGATERDVANAILIVGVRDSKAHADGEGAARRWSPQAQALARREWRSREGSRRG